MIFTDQTNSTISFGERSRDDFLVQETGELLLQQDGFGLLLERGNLLLDGSFSDNSSNSISFTDNS